MKAAARRVIVESPFAAETPELAARNRAYLAAALRDCLDRGEAPFASHGLYTLPGVLDDDVPEQRAKGIAAGLAWQPVADAVVVYADHGISAGMRTAIKAAHAEGMSVELRSLGSQP